MMYKSEEKKVNEQFRRKMDQDVGGNRKYFWKEVRRWEWRLAMGLID